MYEAILNSKKIKYTILQNLVEPDLINAREVNCFMSLNSIIKNFYTLKPDLVATDLSNIYPNALSAQIINVISHYRHFFFSRYHLSSNYYIYYSFDMSDYCVNLNINYKKDFYAKRNGISNIKEYLIINEKLENNMKYINIIQPYLPNIFFINTQSFEPSALPQLFINKIKDNNIHNFIFTSDSNEYQLANNKNTSVIILNSDNSKVLHSKDLIGTLLKNNKNFSIKDNKLSPDFYVPILALSGYKKFNIEGIKGIGCLTAVKKLNKGLNDNIIENIRYRTMDDISILFKKSNIKHLNNNFKILDLKNITSNIRNIEYLNIKKQIVNKSDNLGLMDINNKYYTKNPLMLIELMEGE